MSRRETYKGYVIEIIKQVDNSWKATVTREDGNLIKVKYGSGPVPSITTSARYSEQDAFDEGQGMIDGGGMDAPAGKRNKSATGGLIIQRFQYRIMDSDSVCLGSNPSSPAT
jgi:hypothetical protein